VLRLESFEDGAVLLLLATDEEKAQPMQQQQAAIDSCDRVFLCGENQIPVCGLSRPYDQRSIIEQCSV
jgi:hypothetical protein